MKTRPGAVVLALALCIGATGSMPTANSIQAGENVLINLYDHMTGEGSGDAIPDWGYSALIRYNGYTILFDGGTSAVILEHNAKALGVDLTEVDIVVLSHSHGDHTGGIDHVVEVNPDVAIYVPSDWGFGSSDEETDRNYRRGYRWQVDDYHTVKETTEIAPGVTLIHTTSPNTGGFSKYPPYEQEPRLYELVELSLALTTESGDVMLIVGCSHSGVGEIAKATGETLSADIALVTGGFHLGPYSPEYVTELAGSMRDELGVKRAAATHCTGEAAIEIFKGMFGDNYVWGGLGAAIKFPE
jgi:7,8-dihydropterin-6-yl-methyl-4-(beta-D-ribofuranosyl)aminobenzene 5'-phosphate synthase